MEKAKYLLNRIMDELFEAKQYMTKVLELQKHKSPLADDFSKIVKCKIDIADNLHSIATKEWEFFKRDYCEDRTSLDNSAKKEKSEYYYEVQAYYKIINDTYIKTSNEVLVMSKLYKDIA